MDIPKLIISELSKGIKDSVFGVLTVLYRLALAQDGVNSSPNRTSSKKPTEETGKYVAQKIMQCCMLNGVIIWLSLSTFSFVYDLCDRILADRGSTTNAEHLDDSGTTISPNYVLRRYALPCIYYMFSILWVIPVYLVSKLINIMWFGDIAKTAFILRHGKKPAGVSFPTSIADMIFNFSVQLFFLLQAYLISFLPITGVGWLLSLLHLSLLYSLYSFEYKWYNAGLEMPARLQLIETNWPYYIGFGLPLAILTDLPYSFVISGCVFGMLFPLFMISANEAKLQESNIFRLEVFSLVMSICNFLVRTFINIMQPSRPSSKSSRYVKSIR